LMKNLNFAACKTERSAGLLALENPRRISLAE
jgi:hypothetical protein